jgi:hypothetical protein
MQEFNKVNAEIRRLTEQLLLQQREDGTWRFCFDNGISTAAYMIILLRSLEISDESLIRQLHDRIAFAQQKHSPNIGGNTKSSACLNSGDRFNLSYHFHSLLLLGYDQI